ncbi:hypothetical protein CORAM0001_0201 [Corynebacterium amycolatum SK46]|nr:hypothetical protein CORAM0001_0201 [Corynebacterium amycolatum SK46]
MKTRPVFAEQNGYSVEILMTVPFRALVQNSYFVVTECGN